MIVLHWLVLYKILKWISLILFKTHNWKGHNHALRQFIWSNCEFKKKKKSLKWNFPTDILSKFLKPNTRCHWTIYVCFTVQHCPLVVVCISMFTHNTDLSALLYTESTLHSSFSQLFNHILWDNSQSTTCRPHITYNEQHKPLFVLQKAVTFKVRQSK